MPFSLLYISSGVSPMDKASLSPAYFMALKIGYEVVEVAVYMKGEQSLGLYSLNINPVDFYYDSS